FLLSRPSSIASNNSGSGFRRRYAQPHLRRAKKGDGAGVPVEGRTCYSSPKFLAHVPRIRRSGALSGGSWRSTLVEVSLFGRSRPLEVLAVNSHGGSIPPPRTQTKSQR